MGGIVCVIERSKTIIEDDSKRSVGITSKDKYGNICGAINKENISNNVDDLPSKDIDNYNYYQENDYDYMTRQQNKNKNNESSQDINKTTEHKVRFLEKTIKVDLKTLEKDLEKSYEKWDNEIRMNNEFAAQQFSRYSQSLLYA